MKNLERRKAATAGASQRVRLAALATCLLISGGWGCSATKTASNLVEVQSLQDPYFPNTFEIQFSKAVYRQDSSGDFHLVAQSDRGPNGAPAVTQILHAHVFLKPQPGRTPGDPTTTSASLRWVIANAESVSLYEGTGFIFLTKPLLGDGIDARIEQARLRPVARTVQDPKHMLGPARVEGALSLQMNPNEALDLQRDLELRAAEAQRAERRRAERRF